MEASFLPICFLAFFGSCFGHEKERGSQVNYWRYVSLNGTSPLLFRNVKAVSRVESPGIRLNKPGVWDDVLQHLESTTSRDEHISFMLQTILPPFALTGENIKSEKCKEDSNKFLKRLNKMDLWALKMYDSSAKLPSGLLNGNVNQFGDFDQCMSIDEPSIPIKGKYCLAYFQLRSLEGEEKSDKLLKVFSLLQSHFFFKSKLSDPGHRVPRFSTWNWGLCIPDSCSSSDVESHLKSIVRRYSNGTGFDVEVKVDSEMCQDGNAFKASASFLIVSCLFLFFLAISGLATLRDSLFSRENDGSISVWSVIQCFSLKKNVKTLLSLSRSSDDIHSIHGIRMLNALLLVVCHKSMALFFVPYSNRTAMVEKLSQPWTIFARMASLYTDSFIMISGLLTSYSLIKTLKKTGKLNIKNEYISRLIRIVPPLGAIILLCTFILPELGSGPQWNLAVTHHASKCRKYWWRNFLFIHNYFGFENMCLTHTHHLGIDTQLFFASPFLVYLLFRWPALGTSVLVGVAAISTMARYEVTVGRNLSFFIYPGISVKRMFNTANYSYIIPFHRLTAYVIGILIGYVLRLYGKDSRIKFSLLRIGWTITLSFLWYILTRAHEMNRSDYVYNNEDAGVYAALSPVAWCLFIGWIIFVTQIGCGGFLGRITSSKYFLIWTRLSYSVYLTQFPIFFFNVGLQKHPQQYSILLLVNIFEYLSILMASILLTLFFDMPFVNMKKLFIKKANS